jgi:hypothetical protein
MIAAVVALQNCCKRFAGASDDCEAGSVASESVAAALGLFPELSIEAFMSCAEVDARFLAAHDTSVGKILLFMSLQENTGYFLEKVNSQDPLEQTVALLAPIQHEYCATLKRTICSAPRGRECEMVKVHTIKR